MVRMIGELLVITLLCELADELFACTYVVESRRVIERAIDPDMPVPGAPCDIARRLKDRWSLVDRPREKLRIRGNAMIVKYNTVKLRYRCMENRGNTFLLWTSGYLGLYQGVLCLGFAQVPSKNGVEYNIVRLNGHGPEHHLLSPQTLDEKRESVPTINETCTSTGNERDAYASIRRTERRCTFPVGLQQSWNYTYRRARHVTFAHKTFTLKLFDGDSFRFDCSVKDGDLYVLRSRGMTHPELDGILCLNITRLEEDPYYLYEMSRLNSGEKVDNQVKLFPTGTPISLYEDCDWLESPARPEYLY